MSSYHIIRHNLKVQGDIILDGVVDGRDIAVDGVAQDNHIAATSGVHGVSGNVVGTSDTQVLTNKTLTDSSTYFQDDGDNTKKAQFELSGIGSGQTRILSLPDADTTLVGVGVSQTLTNKTIDADNNTLSNIADAEIKAGAAINASKIADGSVSNTEFQRLNGVGSAVVGVSDTQTLTNKTWGDNLDMGNFKITNVATPTGDHDVANKLYVDSVAQGLDAKDSVRTKTDTDLPAYTQSGTGVGATLTASSNGAIPTIDGITVVSGDRILVDSNGTTSDVHNGIYVVSAVGDGSNPWVLTRAEDADQDSQVTSGMYVFVDEGSCAQCGFVVSTAGEITVDTTAIHFVQFNGAGNVSVSNIGSGGVGLFKQKTGNVLEFKNINVGSNRLSVVNDGSNNEIDIDVVEANINILNLSGAPSSTIVGATDAQVLTNKTLTDASTYFQDDGDNTKKAQLDLSGIGTGVTRVFTLPNADTTLVGVAVSQTLTNKTIDADNNTISNIGDAEIKSGAAINTSKIADGSVSNTEFQFLDGVTSSIQGQIDDHNNATSGIHGVSGNVVGTSDTQTLSNKTLDGVVVQNNMTMNASYIEIADITAPANAGSGKGRIYKKTGDDGLFWKPDAAGAEIDLTASGAENIGTAGVGIFKQVSGGKVQMKKVNAGSSKISIVDDTGDDEVDFDVVEANIVHQNLSGAGTYTHAQIDSHIDSTANPHNVTATQVGNTVAQWNANQIQGFNVSSATPTDGQSLVYDALNAEWSPDRAPKEMTRLFDDFVTSSLLNMWLVAFSGSGSTVDVIDGIGGQVNVTSGSVADDYAELRVSNKTLIKSANFKVAGRFKLSSNLNTVVEFGLFGDSNNLIRFVYDESATPGNWSGETINSGTSTSTDTSVAADTNWHIFEIRGTDTDIKFYIDGTLRATNTTNLPSALLRLYLKQTSKTTTSRTTTCDYIEAISDRDTS